MTTSIHVVPALLRERDAAVVLGVSPRQVLRYEHAGLLRPIRLPGIRAKRYAAAEVNALAEACIAGNPSAAEQVRTHA